MSIESQALVWAHSQTTGSALLALLAIADHDGDGGAWPSMDTIAHRARVSRDAARKLVRKLEEMGEITTERNAGGGLRTAEHMRTNRYEITLDCPPSCDRSFRHRERTEPVDNTPQPNGGGPSARRGTPQPNGGAKHPLNTPNGNSEHNLVDNRASVREKVSADTPDDYAAWRPGQKIHEARRRMIEALEHTPPRPRTSVPPAPRYGPPPPQPVRPPLQPPAQLAENAAARELACPEGFGEGPGSRHLIPATLTGCARCGEEAATILDTLTRLEMT